MDISYIIEALIGLIGAALGYGVWRYRRQAQRWMELAEKYDKEADAWYADWLEAHLNERS